AAAAEAELGAEEHVARARDVNRGLAGGVFPAAGFADRGGLELPEREQPTFFFRSRSPRGDREQHNQQERARRGQAPRVETSQHPRSSRRRERDRDDRPSRSLESGYPLFPLFNRARPMVVA